MLSGPHYYADRLINPEDSIVPYSREMSKDLLDLMITANEKKDIFDSPRNSYIKTHLVASVLERTGAGAFRGSNRLILIHISSWRASEAEVRRARCPQLY